jgi:hypothetical protein
MSRYVTVANMPQEPPRTLQSYALRASCVMADSGSGAGAAAAASQRRAGAAAAADAAAPGVPCPTATPGGPQCSGRGSCRIDAEVGYPVTTVSPVKTVLPCCACMSVLAVHLVSHPCAVLPCAPQSLL